MTNRGKTIYDAMIELMGMWARSPLPDETAIQRILATVYEAGQSDTPDLDAARWRLLESELGDVRATFNGYRSVTPTAPNPAMFGPTSGPIDAYKATQWRFECDWVDLSGSADTIPKLITQMVGKKRKGAA